MRKRPVSSRKTTTDQVSSTIEGTLGENPGRSGLPKSGTVSKRLAKSNDPAFMKFTTYIRKTTHRGVKTRLVSKEKELSDLVEDLLFNWLKENDSFTM